MSENETRQEAKILALRIPGELRAAIERDANSLGVSLSDAARMRLSTGRVPSMETPDAA